MVADAAEAAEEAPRASMIAAPRLATVGMKSFSIQFWSLTTSAAFLPPISAWKMSGYWVAEWLPQIVIFLMSVTAAPVFLASCEIARLWSRRVSAENRSLRDVGGVGHRDQRVGVGRVAGHADADVVGGDRVERLALRGEDRAVGLQQVAALHARAARPRADQQRQVHAVEDLVRVRADLDARQQRERAVVEFHHDTLERLERGLDLEQTQLDRAVGPQQRAAGQAEQQAVADLAGSAGDGDLQRTCAHFGLLLWRKSDVTFRSTKLVETSAPLPARNLRSITSANPLGPRGNRHVPAAAGTFHAMFCPDA